MKEWKQVGECQPQALSLLSFGFKSTLAWMLGTWEVVISEKLAKTKMKSQFLESSTATLGCYCHHILKRTSLKTLENHSKGFREPL